MWVKIMEEEARGVKVDVGDGGLPSNEGRGYVISRLNRRGSVNGRKRGINEEFLYK